MPSSFAAALLEGLQTFWTGLQAGQLLGSLLALTALRLRPPQPWLDGLLAGEARAGGICTSFERSYHTSHAAAQLNGRSSGAALGRPGAR